MCASNLRILPRHGVAVVGESVGYHLHEWQQFFRNHLRIGLWSHTIEQRPLTDKLLRYLLRGGEVRHSASRAE